MGLRVQKPRFLSLSPPCLPQPRHPSRQIAHHRVARDAAHRLMPWVCHAERLRRHSGDGKGRFGVFVVFAAHFHHVHDLRHGPQGTNSCAPHRKWGTFMSRGPSVRRSCAPHARQRAPCMNRAKSTGAPRFTTRRPRTMARRAKRVK